MSETIIETQKITKAYPGVIALNQVDFDLRKGEVHILFGENGAGKSTLISMLAGSNTASSGQLIFDGQPIVLKSVKDANNHGIYTVFQEFSLIPTMTVAENMFLGNEPKTGPFINRKIMKQKASETLKQFGFQIDPNTKISMLSRAQQQMIEIAKALMGKAKVLILDEPTASLTDKEVDQLFSLIRDLKAQGVGVVYISHRMQEFDKIGDRITILRDGQKIATVDVKGTSQDELVSLMTGREISEIYPKIENLNGEVAMRVENLNALGVQNANFEVRKGEVLGVAGLVGSGKSRLWRVIVGLGKVNSGSVVFDGENITNWSTRKILKKGIHYLSPDRKNEGLDLGKMSADNLAINVINDRSTRATSLVNWKLVNSDTAQISDEVELHDGFRDKPVSQLSGGNQQKVLFGKCFAQDCELYIFDEPTVGVDMGTRAAIYQLIKKLCEEGKAVVVISSDLSEVMHISHRLMVLSQWHISTILEQNEINEETVLQHFFEEKDV